MRHPCILLAEDDVSFRDILETKLTSIGYRVVSVADGLEAMEYLSRARTADAEEAAPDLLITDVCMPRCSGIDVLAYTRLWPVATIVLTAYLTPEALAEARELGAAACFRKPVKLDVLCDAARQLAPLAAPGPSRA